MDLGQAIMLRPRLSIKDCIKHLVALANMDALIAIVMLKIGLKLMALVDYYQSTIVQDVGGAT